jgi:GT2 family glycosyltransferase
MISNGFGSASALSQFHLRKGFEQGDFIYEGYAIESLLTGWCIFALRDTIEKINRLNEDYDFWYSDNVYADQLKKAGIRHGLFCNIRVDHLTSATLRTLPHRKQRKYSYDNVIKYRNAN